MLAALEGRRAPAPRHPLDELAGAADAARGHLRSFGPERPAPPAGDERDLARARRRGD